MMLISKLMRHVSFSRHNVQFFVLLFCGLLHSAVSAWIMQSRMMG
jgi:hypothetical protein